MVVTIDIPSMKNLPEFCHECPFANDDMRCILTEERKNVSGWRPFWCPLSKYEQCATIKEVNLE